LPSKEGSVRLDQADEDDDVISLEAKQTKAFEDLLGSSSRSDTSTTSAPFDLTGDLFQDLADVGFSRRAAIFRRENLQ